MARLHPTRHDILNSLRGVRQKPFSTLLHDVPTTSDNLTYHLKYMLKDGLIESPSKGIYALAKSGFELINTNSDKHDGIFPTVSVMLVITDQTNRRLLMQKRKQPHLGKLHDITFGLESDLSLEDAISVFCKKYKIGLEDIQYKCTLRKKIAKNDEVQFDKLFLVHTAKLTSHVGKIEDRHFLLMPTVLLQQDQLVLGSTKDMAHLLESAQPYVEKLYMDGE